MGEALLGGLLAAGRSVAVAEVIAARREELARAYPTAQVVEAPVAAAGAVLVVKPGDVAAAARAAAEAGAGRLLSRAAGITTTTVQAALVKPLPGVRAVAHTAAPGAPRR